MMDFLLSCVDFVLHLNTHLADLVTQYGLAVYGILFAIVFAETGLVIMPFLPGDSLLFAAGSLSAITILSPHWITLTLILACTLGDNLNYWIGRFVGSRLSQKSRWIKPHHLKKTQDFYAQYGGSAILMARFIPIVRTFMPFVAGIGRMHYAAFFTLSIFAACIWVGLLVYTGFYFGNLPFIQQHFSSIIIGIILVSVSPAVWKLIRLKCKK
jgi:membrane-associated protein